MLSRQLLIIYNWWWGNPVYGGDNARRSNCYAIAIVPLIPMLAEIRMQDNNHTKTAAYADYLTVAGPVDQIRIRWNASCRLGPKFEYFPEGRKSSIIVRENAKERSQTIFDNTKIKITTDGQRHLGAFIGTANFE